MWVRGFIRGFECWYGNAPRSRSEWPRPITKTNTLQSKAFSIIGNKKGEWHDPCPRNYRSGANWRAEDGFRTLPLGRFLLPWWRNPSGRLPSSAQTRRWSARRNLRRSRRPLGRCLAGRIAPLGVRIILIIVLILVLMGRV